MDEGSVEERITALLAQRHGSDWGTGRPLERRDFLHGFGNYSGALLYSALFVPELIEVEGCVFLWKLGPGACDWPDLVERAKAARAESPEKLKRLVDSLNWVELPFLFFDPGDSDEEEDALAEVLAQAWRARLEDLLPDRRFVVRIMGPEETGGTLGLGFEMVLQAAA